VKERPHAQPGQLARLSREAASWLAKCTSTPTSLARFINASIKEVHQRLQAAEGKSPEPESGSESGSEDEDMGAEIERQRRVVDAYTKLAELIEPTIYPIDQFPERYNKEREYQFLEPADTSSDVEDEDAQHEGEDTVTEVADEEEAAAEAALAAVGRNRDRTASEDGSSSSDGEDQDTDEEDIFTS
jgi:hypothetical protein